MAELKDDLLTVAETAARLKVTRHTIYRWIAEGRLPAMRYSARMLRLRRQDLAGLEGDNSTARSHQRSENWAERLAPFTGIMTRAEADDVFGAIMAARERSKSDPP
jgi:excisionase family DNA binding protein